MLLVFLCKVGRTESVSSYYVKKGREYMYLLLTRTRCTSRGLIFGSRA